MLRCIRPNAKATLELFSRQATLNFLDLALGHPVWSQTQAPEVFQREELRFQQGAVSISNKCGLLFSDTEANFMHLRDYAALTSKIVLCEQRSRSELGHLINNRLRHSLIKT